MNGPNINTGLVQRVKEKDMQEFVTKDMDIYIQVVVGLTREGIAFKGYEDGRGYVVEITGF